MKSTLFRFVVIGGLVGSLEFTAGCNTPTEKSAQDKSKAAQDEYVILEPEIGSHYRRRVKKSDLAKDNSVAPTKKTKIEDDTLIVNDDRLTSGEQATAVGGPK